MNGRGPASDYDAAGAAQPFVRATQNDHSSYKHAGITVHDRADSNNAWMPTPRMHVHIRKPSFRDMSRHAMYSNTLVTTLRVTSHHFVSSPLQVVHVFAPLSLPFALSFARFRRRDVQLRNFLTFEL